MNKKRISAKIISILLVCLMLSASTMPAVYAQIDGSLLTSGFSVTGERSYKLVSGVTEKHYTLNNASKTNQIKTYAMEVDLSNPDVSIVAGYNDGDFDGWGRATVLNQAAAIENKLGVRVIGGINGDFFNKDTGEPKGLLVMGSALGHGTCGEPYFAILKDGTAVIRPAYVRTDDVAEGIGGSVIVVSNGKVSTTDSYSLAPRSAVGIKADGKVVFFAADGRQKPDSCGMTLVDVANTMLALGCVYALNLDGGGSTTFVSRREAGDSLSTNNTPCYTIDRPVSTSLLICSTAQPTGVFDHVTFKEDNLKCKTMSTVMLEPVGVDENGFKTSLPGGKLVLSDSSYGNMIGKMFSASNKEGEVTVNYVYGDEVVGSAVINVSKNNDDAITLAYKRLIQKINNFISLVKFALEKIKSGDTKM